MVIRRKPPGAWRGTDGDDHSYQFPAATINSTVFAAVGPLQPLRAGWRQRAAGGRVQLLRFGCPSREARMVRVGGACFSSRSLRWTLRVAGARRASVISDDDVAPPEAAPPQDTDWAGAAILSWFRRCRRRRSRYRRRRAHLGLRRGFDEPGVAKVRGRFQCYFSTASLRPERARRWRLAPAHGISLAVGERRFWRRDSALDEKKSDHIKSVPVSLKAALRRERGAE